MPKKKKKKKKEELGDNQSVEEILRRAKKRLE